MGCVGGVVSCVVALRQSDVKRIIAYASVSHISFCISGIFIYSDLSFLGVYIIIISHGFTSSGLFAWAGIIYDKFGRRSLIHLSGMRGIRGVQYGVLILLLIANRSIPPFFSFYGEYFIFSSIFHYYYILGIILGVRIILGLVYSLIIIISSQHSKVSPQLRRRIRVNEREWLVLISHVLPLFFYFFYPGILLWGNSLRKILVCGTRDNFYPKILLV